MVRATIRRLLSRSFSRPFSPLAKTLFPAVDSNLLKFLYDDNQKVEPEWYIPIIPMVLVNGAEGIGTGWACKIPNYNPREIVNNINRMLNHQEPLPLVDHTLHLAHLSPRQSSSLRCLMWSVCCRLTINWLDNRTVLMTAFTLTSRPCVFSLSSPTASQLQELPRGDPRAGPEPVPGQRGDLSHRQEHSGDH